MNMFIKSKHLFLTIVAVAVIFGGLWIALDIGAALFDISSITAEALTVPSCALDATPSSITAGNSSTLSWTSANSASVFLNQGIGYVSRTGGSISVSPAHTTTYSMTAVSQTGTTICQTTITVLPNPAPSCTLSANPSSINSGGSSTLSWTTANAISASIDQGVGSVSTSDGSRSVSPPATRTYTMTALGAGGTVTCQKTITVTPVLITPEPTPNPAPSCALSANPSSIASGGSSILSWTSAHALSASISNNIGVVSPAAGSLSVSPAVSTTYVMTVTGTGNSAVDTATNLIQNGSFETPAFQSNWWNVYPSGTSGLGWTVSWKSSETSYGNLTRPATALIEIQNQLYGPAAEGVQYAELDSDWDGSSGISGYEPSNISISQNIGTNPGTTYELRYYFTPRPDAPDTLLVVQVNGVTVDTHSTTGATHNASGGMREWTEYRHQFVAFSPATTVTFLEAGTADSYGAFLDDVRLYAVSEGEGAKATCSVPVVVQTLPAPTCTLSSNPSSITSGGSSTLSWITSHATSASINQGVGSVSPVSNGSSTVFPSATKIYTMTVTGAGGSATCQKSVTVVPSPTPVCSLSVSKDQVSWSTQNATSVSITHSNGSQAVPGPYALDGSYNFNPTLPPGTHTYTLTASGSGGTKLCQASVTIQPSPAPTCDLDASPSTIMNGSSSVLSWTTTNASSASLSQGIGAVTAGSGSKSVSPGITTTYTMTALGAGGSATCQKTITVTSQPVPFCSVHLAASEIDWTSTNATSVIIVPTTASPAVGSSLPLDGMHNFNPNLAAGETHSYKMTATGSGGSVICEATLAIPPNPAPTCSLDASPLSIMAGGSSSLSWATTNVSSVSINQGIGSVSTGGGTRSVSPSDTTTYTLTALGAGGTVTCQKTVTVSPNPAPTCTLSAHPSSINSGGSSTLSWTTANGTSASIDQGVGSVPPMSSGSVSVSPSATKTYTMTVVGAGGSATCQGQVQVEIPQAACTLSLSASKIKTGESVTISWNSPNATEGSVSPLVGSTTPVSSGSLSIFPSSDTTFTGTFKGSSGAVSCTAFIQVTTSGGGCTNCGGGGGINQPTTALFQKPGEQPLAFVYLSQIPYTGFEAGPALTILFWLAVALLAAMTAYFIMGRDSARGMLAYATGLLGVPTEAEVALSDHEREREKTYGVSYPTPSQNDADGSVARMSPPAPAHAWVVPSAVSAVPAPVVSVSPVYIPEPAQATPMTRPAHAEVSGTGIPSLQDVIESRAHAAGVLMSPEAVSFAVELSGDRAENLRIFGDILNEAVRTIPREDGWIMLTSDRFSALSNQAPAAHAVLATPIVSVVSTVAPEVPSAPEAKTTDEAAAIAFALSIVSGDRDRAYGIIRSLEKDNINPTGLIAGTASVLDRLYRIRKGGKNGIDENLAQKASLLADDALGKLVETFAHALDTVYSSPFTGPKLALAQAFEVVG